jgi:hypothetical protein
LAGANALANRDAAKVETLGVPENVKTDYGTYTPPKFKVDEFKGPAFMGTLPKPGVSGNEILGAGSAEQLTKRLEQISVDMNELVFRISTGGISNKAAETERKSLQAEMDLLLKQQAALQNQPQINITVNGAIDQEGTARTIVDTLNNSFYRGGGGGANSFAIQ